MRQLFFGGIVAFGVIAGIIYVFWTIVSTMYHDWVLGRDVDEIKAESEKRREERRARRKLDWPTAATTISASRSGAFRPTLAASVAWNVHDRGASAITSGNIATKVCPTVTARNAGNGTLAPASVRCERGRHDPPSGP